MWIQNLVPSLPVSVIAWVVLVGGYFLLLRAPARRPERFASVAAHSLVDSAILTLAFIAWAVVVILTATSAAAPIGFVALPLLALGVAVLSFAAAWSLRTLFAAAWGRAQSRLTTALAAILLVGIVSGGAWGWHRYQWPSDAASDQTPPPRIVAIAEDALATSDYATLERLAADPDPSVRSQANAAMAGEP